MTTLTASLAPAFAPSGTLRAAINVGNPLLATRTADGATGISVDIATELARRLGVPLRLEVFDTAGQSVDAVTEERADVGFFAIDPVRGAGIAFTAPYVLIEGCYAVRETSPIRSNDEVDVAGNRVVVGAGSAYDLFLTRALKAASIVRAASSQAVVRAFLDEGHEVAAGVRQQLEADLRGVPGVRLLPGRFMEIRQAMGLPKSRPVEAARALHAFVESLKADGFVADAMRRHRVEGATVAPPEA